MLGEAYSPFPLSELATPARPATGRPQGQLRGRLGSRVWSSCDVSSMFAIPIKREIINITLTKHMALT